MATDYTGHQDEFLDLNALRDDLTTSDMYVACLLVLHDIPIRDLIVLGSRPRRVRFVFDNADGSAEALLAQYNRAPDTIVVTLADVRDTMRLLFKAVDRAVNRYNNHNAWRER